MWISICEPVAAAAPPPLNLDERIHQQHCDEELSPRLPQLLVVQLPSVIERRQQHQVLAQADAVFDQSMMQRDQQRLQSGRALILSELMYEQLDL